MSTIKLRTQHTSLQAPKDTPRQKAHDVAQLFEHGANYPVKTGTEGGSHPLRGFLEGAAEEHDHVIHFSADTWVAINRNIIRPRSIERGSIFVADNDEMVGHGHDRRFAYIGFDHINPQVGRIYQGSSHYPTKGQTPDDPNYHLNKRFARKIAEWMQNVAADRDLAFMNGDFNMPDTRMDWAFGHDFTSMADELKAWEGTGHGPIDGFCSYDKDHRVKPHRFEVLRDSEIFMHSDHFYCQGVWEITLKSRA